MSKIAGIGVALALAFGGCASPAFHREVTTLGQVDMTGLVCRREVPTGTSQPKTTCASQQQWAKYDAHQAQLSADLFDQGRRNTNVDQFGHRNAGP